VLLSDKVNDLTNSALSLAILILLAAIAIISSF
jgi:hypothetical protein